MSSSPKQNITVQLDAETIQRAKVIAAHRGTSVSQLVAGTIAEIVRDQDAYDAARSRAMDLLRKGLHLGGRIRATRDEWHER